MSDLPEIKNGAKAEEISYNGDPLSHFQRLVSFIIVSLKLCLKRKMDCSYLQRQKNPVCVMSERRCSYFKYHNRIGKYLASLS